MRADDEPPRSPGRPVGASGDRTRERILETAIETFAELGFAGASVRDLARRARIRVASLYHYFPSKDALYQAVEERIAQQVREITLSVMSTTTDLREVSREAVGRLFDFYVARPAYVRLSHRLHLDGTDPTPDPSRLIARWVGLMEGLMKPATNQGILKPIEPTLLLISVEGLLAAHLANDAVYRGFYGKGLDDPEVAQRVRDHVIQVVLRAVGLE
jgi:TetR/AcrR family transcriptional regulator